MPLDSWLERDKKNERLDQSNEPDQTRRDFLRIMGVGALAAIGVTNDLAKLKQAQIAERHIHRQRTTPLPILIEANDTARERVRIMPGVPTFSRLREAGVFNNPRSFTPGLSAPRVEGIDSITDRPYDSVEWAITASSEALTEIGVKLADTPQTAELLQKPEVRILCPAAGVLLSPLEIAFQLAERSSALQRVHFTCTEVDDDTYKVIDSYIRRTVAVCSNTQNFSVREEEHPEISTDPRSSAKKKSMSFTYTNSAGRNITVAIDFELKMSGDHYFRAEAAKQADIYLLHDMDRTSHAGDFPQTKEAGDIYTLLTDTPITSLSEKKHFCIMNQVACGWHHDAPMVAEEGVGTIVNTVRGKPFGCGQNHLDHDNILAHPHLENAVVNIIELDSELITYLHQHWNNGMLRAYTLLTNPDALSDAISDDQEGRLRMLRQQFVTKVRTLRNPRIKNTIRAIAVKGLQHLREDRTRRAFYQAVIQATH